MMDVAANKRLETPNITMRGSPGRRFRIPIAAIMALIALLAVELAALRVATTGFVDLTRFLTVAMLAVATYLARFREGDRAAWWFGFALCGWAYLALVIDATARRDTGSMAALRPLPPFSILGLLLSDPSVTGNMPLALKHWWNQYEILQSILTMIVALLGGYTCRIMHRRRGTPYREEERRSGRLDLDDGVE
jgi:hypothetical protein